MSGIVGQFHDPPQQRFWISRGIFSVLPARPSGEDRMLTIRQRQMEILNSLPRQNFEGQLVQHFFHFYPRECREAGRAQVLRLVQTGIERALRHGFLAQDEIGLYINLMIMLGSDCDSEPQVGWAREQLADYSIPAPKERIQKLFRTALDYLGQTAGPESEHIVRALIRIRKHDFQAPWNSTGEQFEEQVAELLSR